MDAGGSTPDDLWAAAVVCMLFFFLPLPKLGTAASVLLSKLLAASETGKKKNSKRHSSAPFVHLFTTHPSLIKLIFFSFPFLLVAAPLFF